MSMTQSAVMGLARELGEKLVRGERLWLFLDYDGTLADFAPDPDVLLPDPQLIDLMARLAKYPDVLRVVIMSGRSFSHIQTLLPVPGILEAGEYGIEYKTWEGEVVRLIDFDTQRPFIDQVKKNWSALIEGRAGFFLEDKGYSLALHGKLAAEKDARETIADAARQAKEIVDPGTFRILGGSKFIEVAPTIADKGQSISMLLKRFPWPGAGMVYIGDDDKDEAAFKVIHLNHGVTILVAAEERPSAAQYRLNRPRDVRDWLSALIEPLESAAGN